MYRFCINISSVQLRQPAAFMLAQTLAAHSVLHGNDMAFLDRPPGAEDGAPRAVLDKRCWRFRELLDKPCITRSTVLSYTVLCHKKAWPSRRAWGSRGTLTCTFQMQRIWARNVEEGGDCPNLAMVSSHIEARSLNKLGTRTEDEQNRATARTTCRLALRLEAS